ncbi:N-acetylneuraminate synthase [Clostridia bacterium]|nr:N-acetylneuraminate synthase [Clostridia bacterium]
MTYQIYEAPRVVAEIGCNHMGDMDLAKKMIHTAATFCNADVVKFQKRNNRELLTEAQYNAPHPTPVHAHGKTYGEHRESLEFTLEQHAELQDYCREVGIIYGCSVWDLTSAKQIMNLHLSSIKIPSACNNNERMLRFLCQHYIGEIHVSLGMTTRDELHDMIRLFEEENRLQDVVLYVCTSGYPVPFKDLRLLEIERIKTVYGRIVKGIGFSGHHLGIAADIAAYTLGASIIERHFTLDRTMKGTDHVASLEPEGLRKLKRDLEAVYQALHERGTNILPIEKAQREKLKYSGDE